MKYTTNSITQQDLLSELNEKYGEGNWSDMLNQATYSLVANIEDYKQYPQYYDFENINENHYVVEMREGKVANIYHIHEVSDFEYSCQEIFWETANEWTNDIERIGHEVYAID